MLETVCADDGVIGLCRHPHGMLVQGLDNADVWPTDDVQARVEAVSREQVPVIPVDVEASHVEHQRVVEVVWPETAYVHHPFTDFGVHLSSFLGLPTLVSVGGWGVGLRMTVMCVVGQMIRSV
jgi:hypothetical protein